jgi:hypothetical protein
MLTPIATDEMPIPTHKYTDSKRKVVFLCECGRTKAMGWNNYARGRLKTCGMCRVLDFSVDKIRDKTFGKLTPVEPLPNYTSSRVKILWRCTCGTEKMLLVKHVVRGATVSCGRCYESAYRFWVNKAPLVRQPSGYPLSYLLEYFTGCNLQPLEGCPNVRTPMLWRCMACGKESRRRLTAIVTFQNVSCGCLSGLVSRANMEIRDFCLTLTDDVELEFELPGVRIHHQPCKFDVRAGQLLIEHHGAKWHKDPSRDRSKHSLAVQARYKVLVVQEHDWKRNRSVVEQQIRDAQRILGRTEQPVRQLPPDHRAGRLG